MKAYFLCGGIAPFIPKFGAIKTSVVSLVSRPLYSKNIFPDINLLGNWVSPRSSPRVLNKDKIPLVLPGFQTHIP
jgi:hypothetical protein